MSLTRHMPANCAVHRATTADAFHIGVRMRPVDRAEIEALEGRVVREFLVDAVAHGARTLTIRGEPVLILRHCGLRGAAGTCDAVARDRCHHRP